MTQNNIEIERKFLVNASDWDNFDKPVPQKIKQGYIHHDPEITTRVRLVYPNIAYITFKGKKKGIATPEFEFEIPFDKAKCMIDLFCDKDKIITKQRYTLDYGFIVDVFEDKNEGLIVAEVELVSEKQHYHEYDFLRKEVTHDRRYTNVKLSESPYEEWKADIHM